MAEYICKKSFAVEIYDDDGFFTEEYTVIDEGQRFGASGNVHRVVGGSDTIRLESTDGTWLEILQETLNEYFEEAANE